MKPLLETCDFSMAPLYASCTLENGSLYEFYRTAEIAYVFINKVLIFTL